MFSRTEILSFPRRLPSTRSWRFWKFAYSCGGSNWRLRENATCGREIFLTEKKYPGACGQGLAQTDRQSTRYQFSRSNKAHTRRAIRQYRVPRRICRSVAKLSEECSSALRDKMLTQNRQLTLSLSRTDRCMGTKITDSRSAQLWTWFKVRSHSRPALSFVWLTWLNPCRIS